LPTADEAAKGTGNAFFKLFVTLKLLAQTLEVASGQPATGLVVLLVLAKYP
jgi:hypothetical protein